MPKEAIKSAVYAFFYFETGTSRDSDMNSTSAEISRNVVFPHAYQYLILFFNLELSKAKYATGVIAFTEKHELKNPLPLIMNA